MRFRTRHRGVLELDMTPMIDVTFLLLIFFLVSAQMAARSRGEVRLPVQAGEAQADAGTAGLVVLVQADGSMLVGDRPIDAPRLTAMAREIVQRGGGMAPVIRADRDAPAAALNAVAHALQAGGLPTFRLATQPGGSR